MEKLTRSVKSPHERTRVVTEITDTKTKCVQSERKNSDINHIVAKAYQTGQLPVLMNRPSIPDLPDVETYQDAMNKVVFANQAFERLPSAIRAEFDNSPAKMLDAVQHSNKNPELRKNLVNLGLLNQLPLAEPLVPAGDADSSKLVTAPPTS